MKKSFVIFFISSLLVSCASTRENPLLGQKSDTEISRKDLKALRLKSKTLWSRRHEKNSLVSFMQVQEKIARAKNSTSKEIVLLARAHLLWGEHFAILEEDRCEAWESAYQWAEKALTFNPEYRNKVVNQKMSPIQVLDVLEAKDAGALFLFAAAIGKWSNCKGVSTALRFKDRVKKMMDRVAQLDPHGHQASVFNYYGVLYSQMPGFNTDDLTLSKANFEKAIATDPRHFSYRVQYAKCYAKKIDDPELYRDQLEWVVQTIPNRHKEDYPEQILEQDQAKKLLEETP